MPVRIKAIDIHAFRGIPSLFLELDGKNLLVLGENGSGKSSIVDAIEFFFRGSLSHFEGEATQTLSLRRHVPHKNFTTDDVKIEITFNPGGVALSRTFRDEPSPPKEFKEYFQIAKRGTFILRRSQILRFIYCKPADRFQAIASILGIESLDEIELTLKRVYDQLRGNVLSKQKQAEQILNDISQLLGKRITNSNKIISYLNECAQEAGLPTIKSLDEVDTLFDKMLKTLTKTEDLSLIVKLNKMQDDLSETLIDNKFHREFRRFHKKVLSLIQDETKIKDLSKRELLRIGKQAIEADDINRCPLCGQRINRKEILDQIDKRLKTLTALSDEASLIRKTSVLIEDRLKSIINKLKSISTNLKLFPSLENRKDDVLNKIKFLEALLEKVRSAKELKATVPFEEFERNRDELQMLINSLSEICEVLLREMWIPKDWKQKYEVLRLFDQTRGKLNELLKIQESLNIERKCCNLAKKLYTCFTKTKRAKITKIYKAISQDLNSFYCRLHPDDPHKNVELIIPETKRASTILGIESFGRKREDPRALTSEGHQDSLGLCIFLAFVKKFNQGCDLIVLDDVVTTIDAHHRELICELLLEEFRKYQFVITTHDEVWYEQLRSYQRISGMQGKFVNLKIVWWDAENGPNIEPYKSRWNKIQERITLSDKHGAGIEGRLYLEWLLKKICHVTKAPVPFKASSRYTVADLLYPAKKRLEKLIAEDSIKKMILQGFQNLESKTIMGNILSHDNPLTETVSILEVKRFCEAVHKLHNLLCCKECGSFLEYYSDVKKLRCPNSKCRKPTEIKCK